MFDRPDGYDLTFQEIEKPEKFVFGKRITNYDYKIFDPLRGEFYSISRRELVNKYISDPKNKKIRVKKRKAA